MGEERDEFSSEDEDTNQYDKHNTRTIEGSTFEIESHLLPP